MVLPSEAGLADVSNLPDFYDELARRDFSMFLRVAFPLLHGGALLDWNWHLDAMVHALDRVRDQSCRRLLVNLPPRNLKSFAISVAWVAWMLGRNPGLNIVCVSYSSKLSEHLARQCLSLMQTATYLRLFPKTKISRKRSASHDFHTSAGGGRLASSITGTLTGRGGDIIIIDDPIKPDDVFSDVVREKVNEWFRSTLASRLNNKLSGAIICVMQRLHQYDLAGLMLEDGGWEHLSLPAIADEDRAYTLTRNRSYLFRKDEVLHPDREPLQALLQIRQEQGSDTFNAQYLQSPVAARGNIILAEWLVYQEGPPPTHGEVIQSWDTGVKDGERNDYSACVTARLVGKHIHILDVFRKRLLFPDLQRAVIAHALEHRASTLLVEDAASGAQLLTMLRENATPGVPFPIPRTPEKDKISRVHGISSMIESGRMVLPASAPWLTDFKAELLAFPSARFDDQVDALSQLLGWVALRGWRGPSRLAGPEVIDEGSLDDSQYPENDIDPWMASMN